MSWKTIRISVLLIILAVVALDQVLEQGRLTSWERPLRVVIYPVNADGSDAAQAHIAGLRADGFKQIEKYLTREAKRHGLAQTDLLWVDLAPPIDNQPPAIPHGGSVLSIMSWSLKLRYWMWRNNNYDGPRAELRVIALYHDPQLNPVVPHSTGLAKGRIALAHLFVDDNAKRGNVLIMHELLHTLGATDKYDLNTTLPHYPDGYVEPNRDPLYPQRRAEIMAGRIPLSRTEARRPESIGSTQLGPLTAAEIGWSAL